MDFSIRAVGNKKKSKIAKSPLPELLPIHPSRTMFSGRCRSGKTNLVISLIHDKRFLRGYFDLIFLFSPSADIDDAWDAVVPSVIHTNHVFSTPDPLVLEKILLIQQNIIEEKRDVSLSPKILLIMDDVIDDRSLMNSQVLSTLFFRGRHFNISCWICTQSFNKLGRAMRMQMSNLFIFKPQKSEEEVLAKDLTPAGIEKDDFIKILQHCTSERYGFLHLNLQKDTHECFRKGLDTIVKIEN